MAEVVGKLRYLCVGIYPSGASPRWRDLRDDFLGAKEKEVAVMATLTSNLHLMMDSFYKPTPERYRILCEAKAFPSDQVSFFCERNYDAAGMFADPIQYAFVSQALAHGLDPAKTILALSPREGEYTLREEDILRTLDEEGSSIALVLFSGVQYYTGQWFPMESITRRAKELVRYTANFCIQTFFFHHIQLFSTKCSTLGHFFSRGRHMY